MIVYKLSLGSQEGVGMVVVPEEDKTIVEFLRDMPVGEEPVVIRKVEMDPKEYAELYEFGGW